MTKGRRVSLLLVRERSRRLLVHKGFKDRAATIKAKTKSGAPSQLGPMTCYHCH